jgi:hypothetical protein
VICGQAGGAQKQTVRGVDEWGHIVCGLFTPELWFENGERLTGIAGFEYMPPERATLTCRVCKQQVGSCVQCEWKPSYGRKARKDKHDCFIAFHPFCAQEARADGWKLEMLFTAPIHPEEEDYSVAKVRFCPAHRDTQFDEKAWLRTQRQVAANEDKHWNALKAKASGKGGSKKKGGGGGGGGSKASAASKEPVEGKKGAKRKSSTAKSKGKATTATSSAASSSSLKSKGPRIKGQARGEDEADSGQDSDDPLYYDLDMSEVQSAVIEPASKKARIDSSTSIHAGGDGTIASDEKRYMYRQYCERIGLREQMQEGEQEEAAAAMLVDDIDAPPAAAAASSSGTSTPFLTPSKSNTSLGANESHSVSDIKILSPIDLIGHLPRSRPHSPHPLDTSWSSALETSGVLLAGSPRQNVSGATQDIAMLAEIASGERTPEAQRQRRSASSSSDRLRSSQLDVSTSSSSGHDSISSHVAAFTDTSASSPPSREASRRPSVTRMDTEALGLAASGPNTPPPRDQDSRFSRL